MGNNVYLSNGISVSIKTGVSRPNAWKKITTAPHSILTEFVIGPKIVSAFWSKSCETNSGCFATRDKADINEQLPRCPCWT